MKYVPKSITRAIGRSALKAQKSSPTLLFAAGIVGVVGATVLACKATLEVENVLTDHEKKMLEIGRAERRLAGVSIEGQRERQKITLNTTGRLCKLYAPSVIVMGVSVVCLTKSHRILTNRNTQLTAAYVGLQKFLEGYRGRVRQEVGEEKERDIYYASTPVELVQDTPNGPKKIFGSSPGMPSPYSAIFDETNDNWVDGGEFNIHFIRIHEQLLTDRLRANGNLFLNEVYDVLGLPRTPTGQICGWMIPHSLSDDFVEIKITHLHDVQGSLMLDFNVAGVVYDMLDDGKMSR